MKVQLKENVQKCKPDWLSLPFKLVGSSSLDFVGQETINSTLVCQM